MSTRIALLPILLLALLLVGATVAVVLLLAHPKTRVATAKLLLVVVGLIVGLFALGEFLGGLRTGHPEVQMARVEPPNVSATPAAAVLQGEDELSQAVAMKTVGVLEAIAGALGRALTEEEQDNTAKEDAAEPVPSVAEKPAGDKEDKDGGKGAQPALTLALSQGERGPDEAKTRPAWVDAPPQSVDDAYQMSITVGPYTTRAECDAKLPEALQEALGRYVDICLGDEPPVGVRLPPDELRDRLVKDRWEETRKYSVGPMTQLHVLLWFDHKFKERVLEQHRRAIVTGRLQTTTAWAAIGLILLATAFAYLKVDLATDGVYRGRLRLATATVILALVIVVVAMIA